MIKKKLNILLLLSLALLSLSLLNTTSYARELTRDDITNFIYNYCVFYGYTDEQAEAFVSNFETLPNANDSSSLEIDRWLNIANNLYPNQWALIGANNRIIIWRYGGSETNMRNNKPYMYDNYLYVNTSFLNVWKTMWYISTDSTLTQTYSQGDAHQNLTVNTKFFYTDCGIYSTSVNGNLVYAAGTSVPTGVFDSNRVVSGFDIDINADFRNNKATISNDTSGTQYYLIPYTSDKVRIGNMFDYSNLAAVIKRKFRYKQSTRSFDLIQEFESNTNNLEYFDIADDTLIVFEYCQPDTTEFITFVPKADTGFSEFTVPIYYTSANTSVVNGVIDTGDTFSGDNYNNYNNDTNTDKIIDNINDDTQVDSSLNEFVSGDAQDIANKFGFRLFNQEYYDFVYRTITRFTDVLQANGDVYFDYSMHGESPTRIYASSFTIPNGALKTFLSMFLVSCTVFAFYKYIADLLELISTGNILEALDEFKIDRNIFKM